MSDAQQRRAARIAAVQALYQMELAEAGADEVVEEFIDHRLEDGADADFFTAVVRGVPPHQVEIDRTIAGALNEKWTIARLDSILRAILRCAVFELVARRDVPAKVVIDEYIAVAHAFEADAEAGFLNGALDAIARRKRAREFGLPVPEGELDF
jgi:N utilization substance protein B